MLKSYLALLLVLVIVPSVYAKHMDPFATGSPTLSPNPVPKACSSNCKPIFVSGPTLGPAITFSVNTSITGKYKVLLGPSPTNVTLSDNGICVHNQKSEAPIPTSFGPITPLVTNFGYAYCLYYTSLPAAQAYSLEATFKHPGDVQFIQTISWTIP